MRTEVEEGQDRREGRLFGPEVKLGQDRLWRAYSDVESSSLVTIVLRQ